MSIDECQKAFKESGFGNQKTDPYFAYKAGWEASRLMREIVGGQVIEIKPCPYVSGFSSDNSDIDFMLRRYDRYSDFILFENGKPNRCFRFTPTTRAEDKL